MIDEYKEFFEDLEKEICSQNDYCEELVNKSFKKIKNKHNIEIINPKTLETITNLYEIEKEEAKYLHKNLSQLWNTYTNKGGCSCLASIIDAYDYIADLKCNGDYCCEVCILKAFIRINVLKIIKLKGD